MLRKLILLITVMMPALMWGQLAVGSWMLYSPYRNVERMVETREYVYYMSEGALTRVDKAYGEVQSLNVSTLLNDSGVTGLYVDRDGKSILVTYESAAMDRLYDDGRVVNISDIRDAVMTVPRTINSVDFSDNSYFVGTDFGVVTFDSARDEVKRTVYTPSKVKFVVAVGNYVGVSLGNKIFFGKNDNTLTSWDKFTTLTGDNGNYAWFNLKGVGDKWIYATNTYSSDNHLHKITLDFDAGTFTSVEVREYGTTSNGSKFTHDIDVCRDGIYACNDKGAYVISHSGEESYIPGITRSSTKVMSYYDNASKAWSADSEGVKLVDVASGNAELTTARPSDLTVSNASGMHVGASGKVYVYSLGEKLTWRLPSANKNHSYVDVVSPGGRFTDVSANDVETTNRSSNSYTPTAPHHVAFNFHIFEDPSDPEAYYIGSLFEGCYRIKNGKQTHKYDASNSPIGTLSNGWAYPVGVPLVDRIGNLWMYNIADQNATTANRIHYLPASKRSAATVTAADWTSHAVPNMTNEYRDPIGVACQHSNHVVFFPGRYNQLMVVVNHKGTESAADDVITSVTSMVDQDSRTISSYHRICAVEDKKGRIWVGTESGVFEVTDLSKVTSSTITVNHLKVPRNDGTGLADYLLDGMQVNCIAVDNSNRKWIATDSGVYYVSEDGNEILDHFTTDNSILPSNVVYAAACDPTSNSVYFGTASGVVEYNSTSSPGSDNYDNVVAYPNPVRPDYTGWITIKGLMEDSLVKIADAHGNVFHQGRSNGGMYVWDGCNSEGRRVKTGVYYVFASHSSGDGGGSDAVVTKIMVVN